MRQEQTRIWIPSEAYAAGILFKLWIIETLFGRDGPSKGSIAHLLNYLGVGRNILISLLDHITATDGRQQRMGQTEEVGCRRRLGQGNIREIRSFARALYHRLGFRIEVLCSLEDGTGQSYEWDGENFLDLFWPSN